MHVPLKSRPCYPANQLLPSQPAYLPSHPANLLTLTLSLLPRNRGTALGIVQSEVQEMFLPSHPATNLPSHPATNLPSHPATTMLLPLFSNSRTALLLMQAAQSTLPRQTLLVLPLKPMLTQMPPPHSLLTQPPLDSRRVQLLARNRGTVHLLMQIAQSTLLKITLQFLLITFRSHSVRAIDLLPTRSLAVKNAALLLMQAAQPTLQENKTQLLLLKTLRILLLLEMILLPTRLLLLQPPLDSWRVHLLAQMLTSTLVQLSDFYFIASSLRLSDFYFIASSTRLNYRTFLD
jgi:hypothetical protein